MPTNWTDVFDIHASIKIIRHISAGIYRNPANALKEQIINSFDAAATRVDVTFGSPTSISEVIIADNGVGMAQEDMEFSFQHIGASLKRVDPSKFQSETRPIVGQFGIGMLAAAHASPIINIETTPKDLDYTLKILIDLSPYFKFEKQMQTLEEFVYGSVKYEKVPREKRDQGTTITLAKKNNQSEPEATKFWTAINRKGEQYFSKEQLGKKSSAGLYEKYIDWIDSEYSKNPQNASVKKLRGYEEFLWTLGLLLPIEYVEDGPIRKEYLERSPSDFKNTIEQVQKRLHTYDFHVFVDEIEIKRPVRLPSNLEFQKSALEKSNDFGTYKIEYRGKDAIAHGYLIWQPYVIRPSELRGIYPRIKAVGVGGYDNTLFRLVKENSLYQFTLSGEIDLEKGFDDALNLDRTGFIETDPAYVDLTDFLEEKLNAKDKNSIFKRISKEKRARQTKLSEDKNEISTQRIQNIAHIVLPKKYEVRSVSAEKYAAVKNADSDYSAIKVSHEDKVITVQDSTVARNPLLVLVLIAIDNVLQNRPEAKELADEIKKEVSRVFEEYGKEKNRLS